MFATAEDECEGDADSQREASEDEPASLPVTHKEGRLSDLLPRAEMVDDGTSRQCTNCGAEAIGQRGTKLDFDGHFATFKRLVVGIGDNEIDILDAFFKHVVDSISAATADTNNLYDVLFLGNVPFNLFFVFLKQGLSHIVLKLKGLVDRLSLEFGSRLVLLKEGLHCFLKPSHEA